MVVIIAKSVTSVNTYNAFAYTVINIMSKMFNIHYNPVNGNYTANILYKLHIKPRDMNNV